MTDKTHWDCDKPALSESFALGERGGGRVERDGADAGPADAWLRLTILLVDSCSLTPNSSEDIEAWI